MRMIPKESGYYWVKFSKIWTPEIVYVDNRFVVLRLGDRNRYSFNDDVVQWCSGKLEMNK